LKGGIKMAAKVIDWIGLILLMIGGLNWGLVGVFNFDLVAWLFGAMSMASKVVYSLVGLAALWEIVYLVRK
jgi:hypothetical protein